MAKGNIFARVLETVGYAVTAFAMSHVLLHFSAFVSRFHDMSLFVGGWDWFASHFDRPGGLVLYLGRFLTQFCKYPWAGISLLLVVFACITFLVRKLLVRDVRYGILAVIPVVALFAFISGMGYEVLTARADAQIFTQPMGFLFALMILWIMQIVSSRFKSTWAVSALLIAIIAVSFPLIGVFTLLGALTFAFWGVFHLEGRRRWILPIMAILAGGVIPPLSFHLFYNHSVPSYIWLIGFPFLDYADYPAQIVKLAIAAFSFPLLSLPRFKSGKELRVHNVAVSAIVFGFCIWSIYTLPERRSLVHRQFEAERAISDGDWNRVLSLTATKGITTDVLVAYRNCALYALGRLPQDCWKYSFETVTARSGNMVYPSSRLAGPGIFYHSGLINYAARWASEISLYGSYSIERIQYLAKAALMNGEYDLARKYIATVGRTTLDKAWARKYMAYAENPSLIQSDPEFTRLLPLLEYDESGWYPSDVAAYNVLMFYSFVKGRSAEMLQWNLAAAILTKAGEYFEELYPDYSALNSPVPPEIEEVHHFFKTLSFDGSAVTDPYTFQYFYYNAAVLRPN